MTSQCVHNHHFMFLHTRLGKRPWKKIWKNIFLCYSFCQNTQNMLCWQKPECHQNSELKLYGFIWCVFHKIISTPHQNLIKLTTNTRMSPKRWVVLFVNLITFTFKIRIVRAKLRTKTKTVGGRWAEWTSEWFHYPRDQHWTHVTTFPNLTDLNNNLILDHSHCPIIDLNCDAIYVLNLDLWCQYQH